VDDVERGAAGLAAVDPPAVAQIVEDLLRGALLVLEAVAQEAPLRLSLLLVVREDVPQRVADVFDDVEKVGDVDGERETRQQVLPEVRRAINDDLRSKVRSPLHERKHLAFDT